MWFPLLALLFCTMRRRNDFAGLHDLASGTRVIAKPAATQRPKFAPDLRAVCRTARRAPGLCRAKLEKGKRLTGRSLLS